jgi:hypothetical protein
MLNRSQWAGQKGISRASVRKGFSCGFAVDFASQEAVFARQREALRSMNRAKIANQANIHRALRQCKDKTRAGKKFGMGL